MDPHMTQQPAHIAGAVLPLGRAEELIASLQSVVSARISASETGVIDAVHVLVSGELTPKQIVRNIESALMAHLGMKVDHRKISVATTTGRHSPAAGIPAVSEQPPAPARVHNARHVYFEDLELRGSRSKGSTCKVTLRHGASSWTGESEGMESTRSRVELAARATVAAIRQCDGSGRALEVAGVRTVDAFDTRFVLVGVETWSGRDRSLLTGTCEIRESAEIAAALAVLDATNRLLSQIDFEGGAS